MLIDLPWKLNLKLTYEYWYFMEAGGDMVIALLPTLYTMNCSEPNFPFGGEWFEVILKKPS